MSKIYANSHTLALLDKIIRADRIPCALLIYGERGLGKKTLVEYIAARLLCTEGDSPCGKCKGCVMNNARSHPDKIYAEKSGVRGGFSVAEVRRICADALIKPNNADVKLYIFSDADSITIQAQNALLKLLEEPPPHCRFIFTAGGRDVFLATVISRMTCLAMTPCTRDECISALIERGVDSDTAARAYEACGGNIGLCLEYISGGEAKNISDTADALCSALIRRDEYLFLKTISSFSGGISEIRALLSALDIRFCDCAAVRCGAKPYSHSDRQLSDIIGRGTALKLHEALADAAREIDGNVSHKLVLSVLCGRIFKSLQGV